MQMREWGEMPWSLGALEGGDGRLVRDGAKDDVGLGDEVGGKRVIWAEPSGAMEEMAPVLLS